MSVLESIGVVAAIGFGAAGLYFGWRADRRAKTAEDIARDSNRIAEESKSIAAGANQIALDSNRIATEANDISKGSVELQREVTLDQRTARLVCGEPWVVIYTERNADCGIRCRNEGKSPARDLAISLERNGEPFERPNAPGQPLVDQEYEIRFHLPYFRDRSANPDDVYLLRFEYRDELPDRHSIERCFRVSGVRNDERTEEWRFDELSCPELEA